MPVQTVEAAVLGTSQSRTHRVMCVCFFCCFFFLLLLLLLLLLLVASLVPLPEGRFDLRIVLAREFGSERRE